MDFITSGLVPIIAILSTIALPIGFGMYLGLVYSKAKHKENMELIKQGIIPSTRKKATPNRYRSLRNGVLCIGIGVGSIVGIITSNILNIGSESPAIMVILGAPILIFLGIAYIIFFRLTKGKDLDEDKISEE